jgi:hypothetical protein
VELSSDLEKELALRKHLARTGRKKLLRNRRQTEPLASPKRAAAQEQEMETLIHLNCQETGGLPNLGAKKEPFFSLFWRTGQFD